jgi:hypothetical protein
MNYNNSSQWAEATPSQETNMLNEYLNSLDAKDKEKRAYRKAFGAASVQELAKIAGITLPESCCSNCADTMTKVGSIWRCECGMAKKAMTKCSECGKDRHETEDGVKCGCGIKLAEDETYVDVPSQSRAMMGMQRAAFPGSGEKMDPELKSKIIRKGLIGAGIGGVAGAGIGALLGRRLGVGRLPMAALGGGYGAVGVGGPVGVVSGEREFLQSKGIHPRSFGGGARFTPEAAEEYLPKEAQDKVVELFELCDCDLDKTAAALIEQGMDKEAAWGALGHIGRSLKGGAKLVGQGKFRAAGRGVLKSTQRAGREIGRTFQSAAKGDLGKGVAGPIQPGQSRGGGVMAGLTAVAKKNPALTAGAGVLTGYGASKVAADERMYQIADAAGRMLAKTAQDPSGPNVPIPLDEIRESIQEAQAREDIPGRARRWQIGGGVGGGVAGGAAGAGAGHLIGGGRGAAIGGLLGAAGGAMGGQHLGKGYGAEEARADKAVSMLRALRAHQAGAMSGYSAGMRRGYQMGGAEPVKGQV